MALDQGVSDALKPWLDKARNLGCMTGESAKNAVDTE